MMKALILVLLLGAPAQLLAAETTSWPTTSDTASITPKGATTIGVFAPLRYGLSNRLEFETSPLLDIVAPNIALKRAWGEMAGFQIASRHKLFYPTGLLKVLSREGTGGVLPYNTRVPHIISLTAEILGSRMLSDELMLSLKAGVEFAKTFGRSNLATIDFPLAYTRTAAYYGSGVIRLGADLDGKLGSSFAWNLDMDIFIIPDDTFSGAFEGGAMLAWLATDEFAVMVGTKLVYGNYPFGWQANLLPLFDLIWKY